MRSGESAGRAGRMRMWTSRSWLVWPAAIAAMFVLAIGVKSLLKTSPPSALPPTIATALPALPASLQTALVASHEHCCHAKNHHYLNAPIDDDAAIARAMQAKLSQAVLVARPEQSGWDFRGAAICPVGGTPAGHLVFVKDDDAISIFSLPKCLAPELKDGGHYETTVDGHPVAVFARNGGLFCLVGSGPAGTISVGELAQMRDHMEAAVTTADATPASKDRTTVAELLYPAK